MKRSGIIFYLVLLCTFCAISYYAESLLFAVLAYIDLIILLVGIVTNILKWTKNEIMAPKEFVNAFLPFAKKTEEKTGISAIATLAQAAVESGWGRVAPGNMFFGVKDTDGVNGNEQLITTTEYSRRQDLKFPVIVSITPVIRKGQKMFKYIVKDYFRKYNTPEECFTDHCQFFLKNPRYANALLVKTDPEKFIDAIAATGYATDPNYAATLKSVVKMIQNNL